MSGTTTTNYKTIYPEASPMKKHITTVEVTGAHKIEGETIPRRNAKYKNQIVAVPHPNVTTVPELLTYAAGKFGKDKDGKMLPSRAVGFRKLIKEHTELKKVKKIVDGKETLVDKQWTYFELADYRYLSFMQFETLCLQIGQGLRKLGMNPGDKLHMFAQTHPFWLAAAHGAMSQSISIVTAYDSLGEDAVKHSFLQTRARSIYVDPSLLKSLIAPFREATDIENVIYNNELPYNEEQILALKTAHPHITILSFEELRALGEKFPSDPIPPKPEDLACVMYTSGSTGTPKGVMLTHKNVVAAIAGLDSVVGEYLGPGDRMLTYLPLAHILEFVFENAALFWGGTLGYGHPKTLSDNSMRNCKGDIREFQPTILVGVPSIWETVRKGVMAKVSAGGFIKSNLFWGAMAAKKFLLATGLPGTSFLNQLVFKKVKEATGGKLRICFNGGGPISEETIRFMSYSVAPLISGYGLTETTAIGAIQDPLWWDATSLGETPSCAEIKLLDFADAGYLSTGKPPRGEICIRGPSVTSGYLDNPEENAKAFIGDDATGGKWFRTGDVGEWAPNGQLRIIDRIKNLVKNVNGEYIALEKLESVYRSDPLVQNVCVYVDQGKPKPIAVVVPLESALRKLAKENGIPDGSMFDLCDNKKLSNLVLNHVVETGKAGKLNSAETIAGIILADEEWTIQNGMLTSAQKLKRPDIKQSFKPRLDKAFSLMKD